MQVMTSQTYLKVPYKLSQSLYNLVHLKDRYIRTRDGALRMRCKMVVGTVLTVAALSMGMTAYENTTGFNFDIGYAEQLFAKQDAAIENMGAPKSVAGIEPAAAHTDNEPTAYDSEDKGIFHNYALIRNVLTNKADIKKKFAPRISDIIIKKGDTLAGALQRNGVSGGDAYTVVKSLSEHFDPRLLRPGQKMSLTVAPHDGEMTFSRLNLISDPIRTIVVKRDKDGIIDSSLVQKEIVPQMFAVKATVQNSLYGSAMKQGVPEPIIAQAIRTLSWSIDFQREIRQGDEIEVLYNTYITDEGEYVRSGEPYYIRLKQKNNDLALYLHELPDGRKAYFRKNGHSAKKGLLSTPVDGARISSGYGMRKHPVKGYTKMHKGVDFAAAKGTPIYAAGDGVVERANWFSSYGKYVKIRHNSKLKTAYAHLNGFGKGIKAGSRVKQGQVIGYVGTTGRSTGPHLHYEVLVNGKQKNPRSVDVPTGEILSGKRLAGLKSTIRKYDREFASLLGNKKLASR